MYNTIILYTPATLSSLSRNPTTALLLPTLLHLPAQHLRLLFNLAPRTNPPYSTSISDPISIVILIIVVIPIVESDESDCVIFPCLPDARFARSKWSSRGCKSTIPENPDRFLSLSASVSSAVKRERSWVWSRISRARMQESALRAS